MFDHLQRGYSPWGRHQLHAVKSSSSLTSAGLTGEGWCLVVYKSIKKDFSFLNNNNLKTKCEQIEFRGAIRIK